MDSARNSILVGILMQGGAVYLSKYFVDYGSRSTLWAKRTILLVSTVATETEKSNKT